MTPLLVFIGPSGAGKSTVVRALCQRGVLDVTPSWTTRPRRRDETSGSVEHRFVSEEAFTAHEHAGGFLEVVRMFGLPYRYGLPPVEPPPVGQVAAVMARAGVLPLVARHFPSYVCYQIEDDRERARVRLAARGSGLGTRLDGYEEERAAGRRVAHRVFVNGGPIGALVDAVTRAIAEDFDGARREAPCHNGG